MFESKMEDLYQRRSVAERAEIIKTFYSIGGNFSETARILSAREDFRNVKRHTVAKLVEKFEQTGSVADRARAGM